ncbi:MAG TPA: 16S rRNA (guanine(527)-N(7))-methyltransferase RsmG [Chitinophagales bacterium]|nr:16S rRNA (guanine(527)-N(7))-methyltransferase RsmG [Chitinophagales bacterium]
MSVETDGNTKLYASASTQIPEQFSMAVGFSQRTYFSGALDPEIVSKYFSGLMLRQREQFERLGGLYKDWNDKINVVSRKDIEQLYEHHVLHSLAIAKWISFPDDSSVLDFGTGGGFPGIPLAIMFPNVQFHLVDSIGKKIKVVNEVAGGIGLVNVNATHTRVEELNERYDFITCRAVAPLKQIVDWTKHLLQKRIDHEHAGEWVLLKGGDLKNEIKESGRVASTIPLSNYFEEEFFADKFIVSMK